jgi:hypothetical protein
MRVEVVGQRGDLREELHDVYDAEMRGRFAGERGRALEHLW